MTEPPLAVEQIVHRQHARRLAALLVQSMLIGLVRYEVAIDWYELHREERLIHRQGDGQVGEMPTLDMGGDPATALSCFRPQVFARLAQRACGAEHLG